MTFTDMFWLWFAQGLAKLTWVLITVFSFLALWGLINFYLWLTDPRRRKRTRK